MSIIPRILLIGLVIAIGVALLPTIVNQVGDFVVDPRICVLSYGDSMGDLLLYVAVGILILLAVGMLRGRPITIGIVVAIGLTALVAIHPTNRVEAAESCLLRDGALAMTGNLNMGRHNIINTGNISGPSLSITSPAITDPDFTGMSTTTFGNGAAIEWTFDAGGGGDPSFVFTNSTIGIGSGDTLQMNTNSITNAGSILSGTDAGTAVIPRLNVFTPTVDSYNSNGLVITKDYNGTYGVHHNAMTIWQREQPSIDGANNPGGCIGFGGAADTRFPNSSDTRAAICYWAPSGSGRLMLLTRIAGATATTTNPDLSLSLSGTVVEITGTVDLNNNNLLVGGNLPAIGTAIVILPGAGTNPSGLVANTAGFFASSTSGVTEMYAIDENDNATVISPHPTSFLNNLDGSCPIPWAVETEAPYLGLKISVDMCGAIQALEQVTGQQFIFVEEIPKLDWYPEKRAICDAINGKSESDLCIVKDPPEWMRIRGAGD